MNKTHLWPVVVEERCQGLLEGIFSLTKGKSCLKNQPLCPFFSLPSLHTLVFVCLSFSFCFLGPHLWHMEVLRLGVELELQLLVYTTATATPDPSLVCDLHHSSRQCPILNPLSRATYQNHILMGTSWVCYC